MRDLELFYDIVSPYSYLGFEIIRRYQAQWDLNLLYRPFFLGGVHKEVGNSAPINVPAKAKYMFTDLQRASEHCQVPLTMPTNFPVFTLATQRFLIAVERDWPDHLEALTSTLFERFWCRDEDVSSPEVLLEACHEVGFDSDLAKRNVEMTADPTIKQALKDASSEAVARGAFGAPTFFLKTDDGEEMFFGSDRFHHLAVALNEDWMGPVPSDGK